MPALVGFVDLLKPMIDPLIVNTHRALTRSTAVISLLA